MRLALLFSVFLATPLYAQATDSSRDEEARRLFQAGQIAYEDARYPDALGYFEHAYELSERPELLFNIGQTADRLRDDERAIAAFELYVDLLPDAENRRQVEVRLDILRTRSTPTVQAPPVAEEQNAVVGPPPADVEEPRPKRWWIGVVVAVVAVAAGVGIAIAATRDGGTQEPLAGDVGPGGVVFTLRSGR
ncbi:MAG: tetratricopeptide repeat protein [Sandaracinus sp.]|nr:tetratricopeptide repeat protein [Sandaracinus sp.]MCB9613502.1 tetratricopeptide repeat protein [Sandaracinus sp.]